MAAGCVHVSAQVQAGVCVCGAIHTPGWQAGRTGCLRLCSAAAAAAGVHSRRAARIEGAHTLSDGACFMLRQCRILGGTAPVQRQA